VRAFDFALALARQLHGVTFISWDTDLCSCNNSLTPQLVGISGIVIDRRSTTLGSTATTKNPNIGKSYMINHTLVLIGCDIEARLGMEIPVSLTSSALTFRDFVPRLELLSPFSDFGIFGKV